MIYKKLKLIRYSDAELRGDYIWFFVDSRDEKISRDFESKEAAEDWLKKIVENAQKHK